MVALRAARTLLDWMEIGDGCLATMSISSPADAVCECYLLAVCILSIAMYEQR